METNLTEMKHKESDLPIFIAKTSVNDYAGNPSARIEK